MKNNIYIMQVLKSFKKNQLKILFSVALIFTLIVAIPISTINVYAALKEDCDLDGFDDATGVAVPWPGYDETKGDTPSGPGTATTPTTAATIAPTKAATIAPTTAAITTAPTAASTNNASVDTTNNTGTTNNSSSNNTSSSTSTSSNAVSGSTVSSSSVDSSAQSTVVDMNSDAAASITVQSSESVAQVSADAIINTKGSLKIIDAKGSIIHAGSSIIIAGSGFSGNSAGLDIVIHSEPLQLGTVTSLKDGSFEVQIDIPDNLEAGTHNIVVSYQGKEITSQQIVVAPKAADTFLGALTVGFSAENKGLIPGLLILAGLIITGGVALAVSGIANARRSKNVQSEVVLKK